MYLLQFKIKIQYKSGYKHLISDTLLRLISKVDIRETDKDSILNIYVYHIIIVEILLKYKEKLIKIY